MQPLTLLVPGICFLILFVHLLFVFLALLTAHFVCLCVIFSPFFSAILQASLLFDFPISLSLFPRTCCEGFRNCRETQGLISRRVSPCFQVNIHLGCSGQTSAFLGRHRKGWPHSPTSILSHKERRHSYSEVWVWISYRKGQHFFCCFK